MEKNLFTAAGKTYTSESQLTHTSLHETQPIYRDVYGRRVLVIHKRFPCFDEFDALYENRYYHHYYIETPAGFVCVTTSDDPFDGVSVSDGIFCSDFVEENRFWRRDLLRAAGLVFTDEDPETD